MSLQVHGRKPQVHVEVIFLLERSDSAKFASLRQGEKLHVATPSLVPIQKEPLECGRRRCLSRQLLSTSRRALHWVCVSLYPAHHSPGGLGASALT